MTFAELLCIAVFSVGMPNADLACYYMETVEKAAIENNIDPVVFVALIYVESRWNPKAISRSGACGLTQIIPHWSPGRNERFGKLLTCRQLFEPEVSIKRGAKIFAYWYHKYSEKRYNIALCGYNAGFQCKGTKFSPKGSAYSKKVLAYANKIRKELNRAKKESEEDIPGCMMYE